MVLDWISCGIRVFASKEVVKGTLLIPKSSHKAAKITDKEAKPEILVWEREILPANEANIRECRVGLDRRADPRFRRGCAVSRSVGASRPHRSNPVGGTPTLLEVPGGGEALPVNFSSRFLCLWLNLLPFQLGKGMSENCKT